MITLLVFILDIVIGLFMAALITPLPVNDQGTVRYNTLPYATIGLIIINSAIFLLTRAPILFNIVEAEPESFAYFDALESLIEQSWTYGARESFFHEGTSIGAFSAFTSTFMHADFRHLIGNMIFLWAFGRRVEDACGPYRFTLFYLFAGFVATIGTVTLTDSSLDIPSIGASGAIMGVLGAYLLLFPTARMGCLWVVAIALRFVVGLFAGLVGEKPPNFKWTIQLPALLVIVFFIAFDIYNTFDTIETGEFEGGVNYVAHTTGFLSAITIFLFVRKDLFMRYVAGRSL